MTQLLDRAFEALARMPADAQDEIAHALLDMASPDEPAEIEPEHLAAVEEGIAQAERGEFAVGSAEQIVAAAFRRHAR